MIEINNRKLKLATRKYGPLKKCLYGFWILVHIAIAHTEKKLKIWKFLFTCICFILMVLASPLFLLSSIGLRIKSTILKAWISLKEKEACLIEECSFRSLAENERYAPFVTILFALDGSIDLENIKQWLISKLLLSAESTDNHCTKFRKKLIKYSEFQLWQNDMNFELNNHFIVSPLHHRGRIITERNIQEFISENCSESLPDNQSPWQVVVVYGFSDQGEELTWVLFKIHHLLTEELHKLGGLPMTFPNPWDALHSKRGHSLFEVPGATKKLLLLFIKYCNLLSKNMAILFSDILVNFIVVAKINLIRFLLKFNLRRIDFDFGRIIFQCNQFKINLRKFHISMHGKEILRMNLNKMKDHANKFKYLMQKFHAIIFSTDAYIFYGLLVESFLELYWSSRALFSLPRLMLEEFFATRSTVPINFWNKKGKNKIRRTIVAWSEDISLGRAKSIKGVTGSSLSSVLITALTGSIRDLLRFSGSSAPENLRCTLPLHIPQVSKNPGLLPLCLPTGCSNGQNSLQKVHQYLEKVREYPERYLASVWLTKHLSKIIPIQIVKYVVQYLTKTHPLLLINLVGPSLSELWGLKLKSIFFWRPLLQNAVISLCISSYGGYVSFGVFVDGWSIPHGNMLPQSFVSHFNELAVESGVKLERSSSDLWPQRRKKWEGQVSSTNYSTSQSISRKRSFLQLRKKYSNNTFGI